MKKLLLLLGTLLAFFIATAQYSDPNIPKPTSGYGADASHTVAVKSFVNPAYPSRNIVIYHPGDIATKVPTIFYSHGYGGNSPVSITGMLEFVAKKGYAIVFVPYQTLITTVEENYDNLLNGFRKAARVYPGIIDTTKVGFMGQVCGFIQRPLEPSCSPTFWSQHWHSC